MIHSSPNTYKYKTQRFILRISLLTVGLEIYISEIMFSESAPLPFSAHDAIILRPQPLGKALARFRHPRRFLRLLADVFIVVCTPLPGLLPGLQLALLNLSPARPLPHSLPVLIGRFDKIVLGRLHLGRSRPIRSRRRPAQALLVPQCRR